MFVMGTNVDTTELEIFETRLIGSTQIFSPPRNWYLHRRILMLIREDRVIKNNYKIENEASSLKTSAASVVLLL